MTSIDMSHGGSVAASGASWTAWSPDGTRLVFAAENLGSDDPYWGRHIWVIEADGSNMAQLTSGDHWDNMPFLVTRWKPDSLPTKPSLKAVAKS